MSTLRITKAKVDTLAPPASGQLFLRDSELKGFAVRITVRGVRSFIIEKRINGRLRRFTLAKYPELTVEQARKEAQSQLGKIATGIDPIAERHAVRKDRITIKRAFEDFKTARRNLSPKTLSLYQWLHDSCLTDWQHRLLIDITKDQVLKKHQELGERRGESTGNFCMRFLSSLFSFARDYYETANGSPVIARNPVDAIRRNRAWYLEQRRQTIITPEQLPGWYEALQEVKADGKPHAKMVCDYLLLLLFTGLRRNEGAGLKVGDVDLKPRLLTVERTKNGRPHVVPLSSFLLNHLGTLIEGRAAEEYLFALPGKPGPLTQPYRVTRQIKAKSGVNFSLHDLRRTFVTVAERLDISILAIKRLVNHSSSDVTAGYVVMDIERLRGPMEQISTTLQRYIEGEAPAQVLQFGAA